MDRKYQQKGYQEDRTEKKESPKEPRPKQDLGYGSRPSPRIETRFMDVVRCANCSTAVEIEGAVEFTDQCRKCGADLHTCKNCRFFDPGSRFECQKPIEVRISKKFDRNTCVQFALKVSIEKQQPQEQFKPAPKEQVSTGRQAFNDLFKK